MSEASYHADPRTKRRRHLTSKKLRAAFRGADPKPRRLGSKWPYKGPTSFGDYPEPTIGDR